MKEPRDRHSLAMHLSLVVATAAVTVLATSVADEPSTRSAAAAGPVLAGVLALSVLAARRWTRLATGTAIAAVTIYHLLDFPGVGMVWPLAIPLYLAAASGATILFAGVIGGVLIASAAWRLLLENEPILLVADGIVHEAGLVTIALLLGEVVYRRAGWKREVSRRFADIQRRRERDAAHRAADQRMSIARDVHDSVAHTLAVIGVQADVAAETLAENPVGAAEAIDVVRRSSRSAMSELRATVALLRGPHPGDERLASPSLRTLDDLVGQVRETGLRVQVSGGEHAGRLPAAVDATAYRVIQEALTNVVRHADATLARITLQVDDERALIEIVDDGVASAWAAGRSPEAGAGLRGMRERATAIGGSLLAGPVSGGGYRVALDAPLTAR